MNYIPIPVEEVITFAKTIHEGQTDKGGAPYHEHLQHVADQMDTDLEKAVAWLHDSVEDGKTSLDEIKKKFGRDIGYLVWLLTKQKGEEYFDYIERLSKNPTARKIKLADLKHNSQISRLPTVKQKDLERLQKYGKAIEMITDSEKLTTAAIIERGWSKSMILKLLGEPEVISSFGYKKLTLYKKKDVIAAENTDEFKDLLAKKQKRSASGLAMAQEKTDKLVEQIENLPIKVVKKKNVCKLAINSYNEFMTSKGYGNLATKHSHPDFLARITVNYIRHHLTEYDEVLYGTLVGRVGKRKAYPIFIKRTFEAIATAYPEYAKECDRQLWGRICLAY